MTACGVWKNLDWGITDRLHERGMIENPTNKAKSLVLTEAGLARAQKVMGELFGTRHG